MNKQDFIASGEAAFGPRWQTDMAASLGVSDRTVRNWVSGKYAIPVSISVDIVKILNERKNEIEKVISNIS